MDAFNLFLPRSCAVNISAHHVLWVRMVKGKKEQFGVYFWGKKRFLTTVH